MCNSFYGIHRRAAWESRGYDDVTRSQVREGVRRQGEQEEKDLKIGNAVELARHFWVWSSGQPPLSWPFACCSTFHSRSHSPLTGTQPGPFFLKGFSHVSVCTQAFPSLQAGTQPSAGVVCSRKSLKPFQDTLARLPRQSNSSSSQSSTTALEEQFWSPFTVHAFDKKKTSWYVTRCKVVPKKHRNCDLYNRYKVDEQKPTEGEAGWIYILRDTQAYTSKAFSRWHRWRVHCLSCLRLTAGSGITAFEELWETIAIFIGDYIPKMPESNMKLESEALTTMTAIGEKTPFIFPWIN